MNCKEGDLAIVIRSSCGYEGKIVRCLKLSHWNFVVSPGGKKDYGAVWETDTFLQNSRGEISNFWMDKQLCPISDNPGDDETLTWAPRKEPVAA